MSDGEDVRDASARLLATAALAGGAGIALYKGFKESPGSLQRVVETVRAGISTEAPRMMVTTPVDSQSRLLSEAFSAAEDVMSPGGTAEMLRRAYERALYGAGVVADEDRARVVAKLVESSKSWEMAESAIQKYEWQLGGLEGLYGAMREIAGGTVKGARGKEVAQLIREMPNIEADQFGRRGGYLRPAFLPGGDFWKERFGLEVTSVAPEISTSPLPRYAALRAETRLSKVSGLKFELGIRQSNRERFFLDRQQGRFQFSVGGGAKVNIPYSEFRVGGAKSRQFLQVPTAVEHRGINFVAADHRGMGFASVPHFAIPTAGGGYRKATWNEGIQVMLYGDSSSPRISGLAERLHKLHGDEKAQRDLAREWNTKIAGLFHRVTGSQGNMTEALMHSESILPIDRILAQISGEEVDTSIEGLTKFYSEVGKFGEVGPLASADPMAKSYRVSLKDWGKR